MILAKLSILFKIYYNIKYYVFVNIIIFDIIFIILMPILFNYNLFLPGDYINFAFNGFEFKFMLNSFFYMFIFAIVIIIFNYILYKAELIK